MCFLHECFRPDYLLISMQLLQCRQLGINAIVILEQLSELDVLLRVASHMRVTPVIGVRAKLTTRHGGHWGSTCGDRAKFGLRPADIMAVVDTLRHAGMLDCLQLMHFHAGSQVPPLPLSASVQPD